MLALAAVVSGLVAYTQHTVEIAGTPRASAEAALEAYQARSLAAAIAEPFTTVDGTGMGAILQSGDELPVQYGSRPAPGVSLQLKWVDGSEHICTTGPAVIGSSSYREGIVTAAHCGTDVRAVSMQTSPDPAARLPMAGVLFPKREPLAPAGAVRIDTSLILSSRSLDSSAVRIARRWPVAGALKEEVARKLRPFSTQLCINGTVSGVSCGMVVPTDEDNLRFLARSKPGDSGSTVFLIDASTQMAILVGVLSAGAGGTSIATFLEPALTRMNVKAMVDEGAAAIYRDDPRLSDEVSPQ